MADADLVHFVREQLARFPAQQLREHLIREGWAASDVDSAIREAAAAQVVPTQSASPSQQSQNWVLWLAASAGLLLIAAVAWIALRPELRPPAQAPRLLAPKPPLRPAVRAAAPARRPVPKRGECDDIKVPANHRVAIDFANMSFQSHRYEEARCYIVPAANAGNAEAQHNLAQLYLNGQGVRRDVSKAVEWMEKAAKQDYEPSATSLGSMFESGTVVPKDPKRALTWMMASARLGNAESQVYVGSQYETGERVAQDMVQAAKLYMLAARQGNVYGQFKLGECYAYGNGTPKNVVEAYKWFLLAARQGDADAQQNVAGLRSLLTPRDVADGERRAAAFRLDDGRGGARP